MSLWVVGAVANGVVAVAYLAISIVILRGVHRAGQWRSNTLAVATGAIFLSCAAGHGAHLDHLLVGAEVGAARATYDLHLVAVDLVTAAIGVCYWTLRARFGAFLGGDVFVDAGRRHAEAAAIHDRVLQQLVAAKLALELDRPDLARRAVDEGLVAAGDLVGELDPEGRLTATV